jgi:hypothetical protein
VFVGALPPDFLRITAVSQQQQEAADQQAALALQQQLVGVPYAHGAAGRLSITVAQVQCCGLVCYIEAVEARAVNFVNDGTLGLPLSACCFTLFWPLVACHAV